jgi:hypothetical protein
MAAQTEETFLETKRERLQKQREDIHAKRAEFDEQLAAIDQELYALDVYVQAKAGKRFDLAPTRAPSQRKASGPRAPRGEPSDLQKRILEVIREFGPDGAKAESINAELNATDVEEKKIAAALFRMKKTGILNQAGRRQPYTLGTNAPAPSGEVAA